MTKQQRRELKELTRRLTQLDTGLNREAKALSRQIGKLDRGFLRQEKRINAAAKREIGALAKGVNAESRKLRLQLLRIQEGRVPATKERAAIVKRIAILDGRQAS